MTFDPSNGARRPGVPRAGALFALLAAFVLIATATPSMPSSSAASCTDGRDLLC